MSDTERTARIALYEEIIHTAVVILFTLIVMGGAVVVITAARWGLC